LSPKNGVANDGDEVRVMKWNVEKMPLVDCQPPLSLLAEIEAMKHHLNVLLAQLKELQVKKD
jgi:hypothetical protein